MLELHNLDSDQLFQRFYDERLKVSCWQHNLVPPRSRFPANVPQSFSPTGAAKHVRTGNNLNFICCTFYQTKWWMIGYKIQLLWQVSVIFCCGRDWLHLTLGTPIDDLLNEPKLGNMDCSVCGLLSGELSWPKPLKTGLVGLVYSSVLPRPTFVG